MVNNSIIPFVEEVAIIAGLNKFHITCIRRGVLAAWVIVVKKSVASLGISFSSSILVRSRRMDCCSISHNRIWLSRPVDRTNEQSSVFQTKSNIPFVWPLSSATGQEVLLRRSQSFIRGVESESRAIRMIDEIDMNTC